MDLKSKLTDLKENVSFAGQTTFRIGGPAKYFFVARSGADLIAAIRVARESDISFYLIGGGSNLLVSDEGFDGLVIKIKNANIKMQNDNAKCKIRCDSGAGFSRIIMETVKNGFSGAEWGFGIPGTIGGAICGNAGRLGQAIGQVVKKVFVLDGSLNEKEVLAQDCGFGYRESRFKKSGEIIIGAELEFQVKEQSLIDEVLVEAKKVVLNSPKFPSAGCIFKNYIVKSESDSLLREHPELSSRVRGGKLGVGFLIDQCGLKGYQVGGAKIWENHANYVVNVASAKAADVLEIIRRCKREVKEKYSVNLEEEVRYVGIFKNNN